MCLTDPCNTYLRGNRRRGTTSVDRWGTTILFPEDAPGPMPDTREGLAVCPDIMRWRETVHAPDLEAACTEGWETCRAEARAACGPDHLLAGFMGTGVFEQCHFLMGFEDTLTNLYAHPDEMHALIDYITEYRLTYVRMLIDNLQPDVIFSHDDWGTKNALFMKAGDVAGILQGAVPPVLWLHPLARRHRHPPRGLLSRAHCGRHG
ncbi:MAG: uroporphyrinogen decarboxylase family protein [Oscillospiraceae bacterium]